MERRGREKAPPHLGVTPSPFQGTQQRPPSFCVFLFLLCCVVLLFLLCFFVASSFFSLLSFGQRRGAPPLSDAPQEDWPCVAFGSSFGPGGVPAPIAPENLWFPDPANPYDGQGALGHICSRQPAPCGTCPSRTDPRQPAPCGTGPSKVVTLVIVDLRGKAPFGTFPLRAMTISPVFDRSVPDSLCLAAPARREPTPDSLHLAALARRRFCFVLLFCLVLLFF